MSSVAEEKRQIWNGGHEERKTERENDEKTRRVGGGIIK